MTIPAVVEPAQPAQPAAPVQPEQPQAPPTPSEIIRELRASIDPETGGLPRPEGLEEPEQERNEDGTFKAPEGAEGEQPVVEGEAVPEGFTELTIPSAREPGKTIKALFPSDDPQLIEEIKFLSNNGMRRDEFNRLRTPLLQQKEELDYIEDRIRLSPAAFVLESMAPESRLEVALSILAQEGILEQALPFISKWTDPDRGADVLRADRAEIARDHAAQKDTVAGKITERRETRQFVTRLTDTVDTVAMVLPKAGLAAQFTDDVLRDIQQVAGISERNAKIIRGLPPAELLKIVAPRLELYGVTLEAAVAALDPDNPRLPTARPEGDTARAVAAAAAARKTGRVFRQGADARRAVAAVPTPVAGAAPPTLQPPKGQKVTERSDWIRQKLGIRPRHGRPG